MGITTTNTYADGPTHFYGPKIDDLSASGTFETKDGKAICVNLNGESIGTVLWAKPGKQGVAVRYRMNVHGENTYCYEMMTGHIVVQCIHEDGGSTHHE
jgi:hypothetical protein